MRRGRWRSCVTRSAPTSSTACRRSGAVDRLNDFTTFLLPGAFATLIVGCLDPATGHIEAVLAGHPVPLLLPSAGPPRDAPLSPSPPIGVRGATYSPVDLTLAPGEGLVLYSDGLIERRDEDIAAQPGAAVEPTGRSRRRHHRRSGVRRARARGRETTTAPSSSCVERDHCSHSRAPLAMLPR